MDSLFDCQLITCLLTSIFMYVPMLLFTFEYVVCHVFPRMHLIMIYRVCYVHVHQPHGCFRLDILHDVIC